MTTDATVPCRSFHTGVGMGEDLQVLLNLILFPSCPRHSAEVQLDCSVVLCPDCERFLPRKLSG